MGQWEEPLMLEWRKIRASSKALQKGCGKIKMEIEDSKNIGYLRFKDIKKYTVPVAGKEQEFRDVLEEYDLINND